MHFVIAGKVNCPQFVFATMIAERLKDSLPEFTYSRITKKSGDWERWLSRTCKENEWFHTKSPIIWREIAMTKGKKYLIGDIAQFLDLCQDRYGLTREMLSGEQFNKMEMEWFTKRSELDYVEDVRIKADEHLRYRCRQVCILGAGCQASDVLIMELLHIPLQSRENGLEIRLYDEPHREKKLRAIADDAKHSLGYSGLGSCRVATNIREALYNVDLVIVLDSFPRRPNESLVKWLKRNRNAMCVLGNALDKYANTHCRVIIGSPSNQPICYNATVLASFATKLHVRNIVAVTQDLGRETLAHLAKKAEVPLKDLNCPPVWGFVGLNKYVDVRNTLQTYLYKVPGPIISKNLAQGSEEWEIRTVDPFLDNEAINSIAMSVMSHKAESMPRLGRATQLAKITAILDLLKVWGLKQEDGHGEILSLGVYSDGTFNIPEGLFWSQPVTLEKGFWKPFARYPLPRTPDINLYSFFVLGVASLAETKVTVRKQRDPKPIRKKRESNKFDMNALRDAVKLPVVKTKAECLELIKRLAKEELGFDLSKRESLSTVTEVTEDESTIETVPQEKIYCECWRQEILQLRKMATVRSSTTEMEVDISENMSGSEWSVVNPPEPYVPSEESLPVTENVKSGTSSGTVVCDCGPECHCLVQYGEISSERTEEKTDEKSTEHFYKRQDARVFVDEDVKDVLYEDMFKKREVRFDPSVGPCAGKPKRKFKFYGTKTAIVDEEKRREMMRRIRRYEGGEEGEGEGGEDDEESGEYDESSSADTGEFLFIRKKFHVSIDDNYEIVGDPEGLEALEEMRRYGQGEPPDDFTDMWADEVTPALQVMSTDSETSSSMVTTHQTASSAGNISLAEEEHGEGGRIEIASRFTSNLEVIPEVETEEEAEISEVAHAKEVRQPSVTKTESTASTRKREGIPRCCYCHCIIPEGELGCHCGETRVMEVLKQESEVVESEHSLVMESVCTSSEPTPEPEEEREKEGEKDEEDEEEEEEEEEVPERKRRDIFSLPPESFFPFSPKPANKFLPSERPPEMFEDSTNILDNLPREYLEMMEEAKAQLPEDIQKEDEENRMRPRRNDNLRFELEERSVLLEMSVPQQYRVTDWTTILKKRYKEWFEKSENVPDDSYYNMADDEPSDEECDADKELSKYFED